MHWEQPLRSPMPRSSHGDLCATLSLHKQSWFPILMTLACTASAESSCAAGQPNSSSAMLTTAQRLQDILGSAVPPRPAP